MEYCPRLGCRPFRADSSAGLSWGVESRSDAVADAPFSDPAHQTGRAVFPHAFALAYNALCNCRTFGGVVRLTSTSPALAASALTLN